MQPCPGPLSPTPVPCEGLGALEDVLGLLGVPMPPRHTLEIHLLCPGGRSGLAGRRRPACPDLSPAPPHGAAAGGEGMGKGRGREEEGKGKAVGEAERERRRGQSTAFGAYLKSGRGKLLQTCGFSKLRDWCHRCAG